jgi:hypothetical protein
MATLSKPFQTIATIKNDRVAWQKEQVAGHAKPCFN